MLAAEPPGLGAAKTDVVLFADEAACEALKLGSLADAGALVSLAGAASSTSTKTNLPSTFFNCCLLFWVSFCFLASCLSLSIRSHSSSSSSSESNSSALRFALSFLACCSAFAPKADMKLGVVLLAPLLPPPNFGMLNVGVALLASPLPLPNFGTLNVGGAAEAGDGRGSVLCVSSWVAPGFRGAGIGADAPWPPYCCILTGPGDCAKREGVAAAGLSCGLSGD